MIPNKNFDMKTARKLINDYAERINILTRENQTLKKHLEDAQTSLKINKEILFSHFGTSSTPEKSFIEDIRKENYRLSEKINWLFQEKAETAKMIYKIQQELDNKQRIERELIEREKTKYFVDDNKLMEKEFKITYLLKQLENKKKGNCAVYIGDPNKFNVEMNSELEATRALIRKYTSLLQKEKQYAIVQSEKIKQLESIINGSKAKQNNQNEEDNIEVIDCVFSSNDDSDILEEDIEECEGDNNSDNNKDKENHKIDDENIQFPEKIKRIKTEQSKGVPKLDLSTVLSKYKKPDNLQIVDKIKKTNRSSDEYIEKLKGQIKIFKATIVRYKARITKLKQSLVALKNQNTLLQQTLKLSNTYNNNTTHAITNAVNESMNPNLSDNSFEEEDENVLNKLNKERNQTSITKNTEPNSNNNNFNSNISFKEVGDSC